MTVVVVGDVMVDVVAAHRRPVATGSDVDASIRLVGGGSAANTACWLGAGGRPVRLAAAVGDDPLGRWARLEVEGYGVEVVGPCVDGVATGTCVVLVDGTGERSMLADRGANDRLDEATVGRALGAPHRWVHVSAYALVHAGSRPAGLAAVAGARAVGTPVSVDLASSEPLRSVGPAAVLGWVDGVDVVFANEDELAAVGGLDALSARVGSVVVKQGARGATWVDGTSSASAPSPPVAAVDSTGAGDALAAGWISARLRGEGPAGALGEAVALGSVAVARRGARPDRLEDVAGP